MSTANPKKTPPLQEQLAQLDQLLAWFDQPDIDLDEALKKFDEGVKLTESIKHRLATFENKVTILKKRFDQEAI
ncbi:MAG TPA: exodeoxyribonuclease VII small subunit [Candidatus Saccharimonadales bacterium]|nr:exodeoxyribonuclease VII small subunit [Candidatus Saccharimonadales bacterium]